eukprot:TRINITY_DN2853_c0_g1_i1.p2 TRINITY_DN2853_c0_g1~~TRINITY_DN2853_c0_g1_i1.p2  ORF type:complete len:54 (-),score=5.45 TRINITY_DN2853_c0_g1_i1:297-458(-)
MPLQRRLRDEYRYQCIKRDHVASGAQELQGRCRSHNKTLNIHSFSHGAILQTN